MSIPETSFTRDIERIQSLEIVPSILELICRTTGMGFAAVARVTEDKWIACAVKDEISFGLKPGGELALETTICNEIRGHGQAVVIDEVSCDEQFRHHHTPARYGFQSYISMPIILKDGTFFGTLCAIDPRPFSLKASNMVSMFNLYADLISYHLLSQDLAEAQASLLQSTEHKLQDSLEDIRQYSHVSRHSLQEPLRKLQIFSDIIATEPSLPGDHAVKGIAVKINGLAKDLSAMITALHTFSEIPLAAPVFQQVDLNDSVAMAISRLKPLVIEKNATVDCGLLQPIYGIPQQVGQLFYHLLHNALQFTRPGVQPQIRIYGNEIANDRYQVCIEDNGMGIEASHLEQIFDLFSRLNSRDQFEGMGIGLSQCKKIARQHNGTLTVQSMPGTGSTFSVVFPLQPSL